MTLAMTSFSGRVVPNQSVPRDLPEDRALLFHPRKKARREKSSIYEISNAHHAVGKLSSAGRNREHGDEAKHRCNHHHRHALDR